MIPNNKNLSYKSFIYPFPTRTFLAEGEATEETGERPPPPPPPLPPLKPLGRCGHSSFSPIRRLTMGRSDGGRKGRKG